MSHPPSSKLAPPLAFGAVPLALPRLVQLLMVVIAVSIPIAILILFHQLGSALYRNNPLLWLWRPKGDVGTIRECAVAASIGENAVAPVATEQPTDINAEADGRCARTGPRCRSGGGKQWEHSTGSNAKHSARQTGPPVAPRTHSDQGGDRGMGGVFVKLGQVLRNALLRTTLQASLLPRPSFAALPSQSAHGHRAATQ